MIEVNNYDELVCARLGDFFRPAKVPWQRRLWSLGTLLLSDELLEASEATQAAVLATTSMARFCQSARQQLNRDPVLLRPERAMLSTWLNSNLPHESVDFRSFRLYFTRLKSEYLARWAETLKCAIATRPPIELTSRLLASTLLDTGFSGDILYSEVAVMIRDKSKTFTIADVTQRLSQLYNERLQSFEILVGFRFAPGSSKLPLPINWMPPQAASAWLTSHGFDTSHVRLVGALRLTVQARDALAASQQATAQIDRISARVALGLSHRPVIHEHLWVAGESRGIPYSRTRRVIDIRSLRGDNRLYSLEGSPSIENALELASALEFGAPAPASASAWAAIESLLFSPGDDGRSSAADRLGAIAACSFTRAELTRLATAHAKCSSDNIAEQIRTSSTNAQRANVALEALRSSHPICAHENSDKLAIIRIQQLVAQPSEVLLRIKQYASEAAFRLYRQRNIVLHWGRVHNAVCLDATLRTVAPLVGALLDRVVHAWFTARIEPLELAARANLSLATLKSTTNPNLVNLL